MSEKALRNIFIFGTVFFLGVLGLMTWDSLARVTSSRTPPLSADVVAGKAVWARKNCNDCHTILGIGGYFAADLTKIAERRDPDWLRRWLADPQQVSRAGTMPNQRLSAGDIAHLVAFLKWVDGINTNAWPPAPRLQLGGGTPGGALLFEQKGCSACHRTGNQGPEGSGPDLSRIGAAPYDGLPNSAEFLARWLDDPGAAKPGTAMPRIPLTPAARDALVQYLTALR
jgi:nitric oxide reductase subunit C